MRTRASFGFVVLLAACADRPARDPASSRDEAATLARNSASFRDLERNVLERRARRDGAGDRFKPLFGAVPVEPSAEEGTPPVREALLDEIGRLPPADEEERKRLVRFLREEDARDRARTEHWWLGESLRKLTRAVARDSGTPSAPGEKGTGGDDLTVARELRADLGRLSRSAPPISVLDDAEIAIDALEHETSRGVFPESLRVVVPLREELDRKRSGAKTDWTVELGLASALAGTKLAPREELDRTFEDAQRELRAAITEARKSATADAEKRAATASHAVLFDDAPCFGTSSTGILARVGFSPERARLCRVLHVVTKGSELDVLYALHDAVALGRWALHAGGSDPRTAHPFVSAPPLDEEDRIARLSSSNRPNAIAPALGAVRLWKGGLAEARARSGKWLAYGDAPLDAYSE